MKISDDVLEILKSSRIEDNKLYLPDTQLDRKLYVAVNKVLANFKGKWNKKEKCHIFPDDVDKIIDGVCDKGEYVDKKKEYQFFETPEELALRMISIAHLKSGYTVLEPSAGKGAIARHIDGCDCIELMDENRKYLLDNGFNLIHDDFLTFNKKYDIIIANPPFTKQQDIDHVTHMIKLTNKKVVAVMSSAVRHRTNKKTKNFHKLLDEYDHEFTELPEKTFKTSGTNVNACLIEIDIK